MKKLLFVFISLFCALNVTNAQKVETSIDLFGGAGVNEYNNYAVGVELFYGYNFNSYFSLSLGVGCRYINDVSSAGISASSLLYLLIPAHARAKINFSNGNNPFFCLLDAGYAYNFNKQKSLVLLEPALGIDFNKKVGFAIGVVLYPGEYTKTYSSGSASSYGFGGNTVEGCACIVCFKVRFVL
ncbi:MAG: hypothetical protein IK004_01650 [Bacteroidales bacterium]|nr:hypothetical protein [Bacteroidales bacterium]